MPPGKFYRGCNHHLVSISGLATRHSAVFRHEEAPAWVSCAWTSLTLLSHGVMLATNMNIFIKVRLKFKQCMSERIMTFDTSHPWVFNGSKIWK